jgi:hypothetical protein
MDSKVELKIDDSKLGQTNVPDLLDNDKQYTICCSRSSVGFIKFSSTFIISLGILIFSFIMIGLNPGRDNTIYFSLISAIMTLFIPSPEIHR